MRNKIKTWQKVYAVIDKLIETESKITHISFYDKGLMITYNSEIGFRFNISVNFY
jgi:hypothetical protein